MRPTTAAGGYRFFLALGLLALGGAAGCATTQQPSPTTVSAMTEATSAIEQAEQVGAQEHAPLELRSAQKKLEEAQAALGEDNHEGARRLAQQATVDAELAETRALSAKAQLAVRELQESIRVLREEMERTGQR
jgi:hypothetical protein